MKIINFTDKEGSQTTKKMSEKPNCIVWSCPNSKDNANKEEVEFFFLPVNTDFASKWLRLVGRTDLKISKGAHSVIDYKVCSKHFTIDQYSSNCNFDKPRLLPKAVPDKELPDGSKTISVKDNVSVNEKPITYTVKSLPVAAAAAATTTTSATASNTQKKVVRLKLPPGMTAAEFASSDVMKHVTSKLSGIVGSTDNKKTFVVRMQPVPSSASGVSKSLKENNAAQDKNEATSKAPAAEGNNVQTTKVTTNETDSSASNTPAESLSSSTKTMKTRGKKLSFARFGGADDVQSMKNEIDAEDSDESSTTFAPKRKRADHGNDEYRIKIKKLTQDADDGTTSDEENVDNPSAAENDSLNGKSGLSKVIPSTASTTNGESSTGEKPNMTYYEYHRQLINKQAQRLHLINKIKTQKKLLVKRGNELCRYRMKLQQLREKNQIRTDISLQECLKALKGNMHEHALELLYTQLVNADGTPRKPLPNAEDYTNSASHSRSNNGLNPSTNDTSGTSQDGSVTSDNNDSSELCYTPKVLEAALLFSVAGKKAYKAMGQSIRIPSYDDIIKWKKIIRSDPQYYKKYFPHLKAKFFRKRKPEERKGYVPKHSADDDQDGWQSEREGPSQNNSSGSKSCKESGPISKEDADELYQKLLADQERFDKVFLEPDVNEKSEETPEDKDRGLPEIVEDDDDIDYDLEASEFIENMKQRELRLMKANTKLADAMEWEEMEKLAELDENDLGDEQQTASTEGNAESADVKVRVPVLKTVDDAITRVLGSIASNGSNTEETVIVSTADGIKVSYSEKNVKINPRLPSSERATDNVLTVLNNEDGSNDIAHEIGGDHGNLFMAEDGGNVFMTAAGQDVALVQQTDKNSADADEDFTRVYPPGTSVVNADETLQITATYQDKADQ